jgi:cell division protein FtsW (lipid II flippase)
VTVALYRRANPRRRSELGLLFVGALVVLCAFVLASLAEIGGFSRDSLAFFLVLLGIIVVVQVVNRHFVPFADPIIMPIVLVLNGIGYVMINRLVPSEASKQFLWTVIGLLLYIGVLFVIRHSRDLDRYRYLILTAAFILLMSPLFPKIGENINGARLWVGIGSTVQFQPVEIAKLLLIIFFASYLVEKREMLTIATRRVGDHLFPDLRAFGPLLVAGAVALLVILAEHDIGFSLLLFVAFLAMLWVTTFLVSHVLPQLSERITVWINPWASPSGAGYQPVQGELAFGRGGLFGSGLGLGLGAPAGLQGVVTSDFIFAEFGEELGLVGTVAIVMAFLVITGCGLRTALRARSDFAKLAAVGFTTVIGFQAFFIMAGVTRLLPLTGITLPFVSYGGSSLVANYALVALLMRISNEGNQRADEFADIGTSRR